MNKQLMSLIPAIALGALVALALVPDGATAGGGSHSAVQVVDLDAVIQKSSKARSIMSTFRSYQDKKRKDLQNQEQDLAKLQKKLTRQSSPDELNAYGRKVQELQLALQKAELDIQQEFVKTRGKLLDALRPTFQAYAKDQGVGILLDKNTGGVVYSDQALDATSELKSRTK